MSARGLSIDLLAKAEAAAGQKLSSRANRRATASSADERALLLLLAGGRTCRSALTWCSMLHSLTCPINASNRHPKGRQPDTQAKDTSQPLTSAADSDSGEAPKGK